MYSGCKLRDVLVLWRRINRITRKLVPVYRRTFTTVTADNNERCLSARLARTTSLFTASRNLISQTAEGVESVSSTLQRQSDIEQRIISLEHNLKKMNRVCKTDLLKILDKIEHKDFPSEDEDFWLLLLKCCGHVMPDEIPPVRMELAYECWKKLEKIKGMPLPIELHNEILHCYVDNTPDNFSVAKFLDSLGDTSPDEHTYDLMVEITASKGDLTQVVEVISLMKRQGLPAKEHTFNNLLRCHAMRRDKESFQQTLDTMRLAQVALTADTFSCIIVGFSEAEDVAQVLKTFEDARSASVSLVEDHILPIVRAAAKTGNDRLLIEVLRLTQARTQPLTSNIINLVVHLVHTGFERAACLLFNEVTSTFPPDTLETTRSSFGVFLLQELVKTNKSTKLVKDLCTKLEDSGQNEWATSKATEAALVFGQVDLAFSLMEFLKSKGRPLRQHYFWPLFLMVSRQQGEGGATKVLRYMQRLGLQPDHETLTDYFLPQVSLIDLSVATRKLQDQGLTVSEMAPALLVTLLRNGYLQGAVTLFSMLKFKTNRRQLIRPLASAFQSSTNVADTVALLKLVQEAPFSDGDVDLVGQFVLELVSSKKSRVQAEQLLALMKGLQREKLHMGPSFAANVRRKLHFLSQDEATAKALLLAIHELTSEEEGATTNFNGNGFKIIPHPRDMSLEELECHLVELRSKNMNTRGVLRRLLQEYCRVKAFDKALGVAQSLTESGLEFSAGMLASILEVYCKTNKLKEAQDCLNMLRTNFPSFSVDAYKVLDLASQLILNDSYEAAVVVLEKHGTLKLLPPDVKAQLSRNCWKLLNAVAGKHSAGETRQLLELLVQLGYCDVTNVLLGPVIKAHLARDDTAGAVSEYERCVRLHGLTPLQHELLCAVCRCGDAKLLGMLSELTISVHGQDSFSVALAAAYAETELTERLKSLLQEGVKWPLLLLRCRHFVEENKLRPLQNITEALGPSGSVRHRDAVPLYTLMMQVLYRRRDQEGANLLWQKLQEEDLIPEQQFITMVTDLLKGK